MADPNWPTRRLSIDDVNGLGFQAFIKHFGAVIEDTPMVAAAVWSYRPFPTLASLHEAFSALLTGLPPPLKAGVVRCHPDLAGALADEGRLSEASTKEQSGAGLLKLTAAEREELRALNSAYKDKFTIPFVICVRENKKAAILSGIRARLNNSPEEEVEISLGEVCKIAKHRLFDIVTDGDCINQRKL